LDSSFELIADWEAARTFSVIESGSHSDETFDKFKTFEKYYSFKKILSTPLISDSLPDQYMQTAIMLLLQII